MTCLVKSSVSSLLQTLSGQFVRVLVLSSALTLFTAVSLAPSSASAERMGCPAGSILVGAPPPDGLEIFCAKATEGTTHGAKNGPYRKYFASGEKQLEGAYLNGERNGVFTTYHKNGPVARRQRYLKGVKHGKWEHYYKNGEPRLMEEYQNGAVHGIRRGWFANGTQSFQVNFEHGKRVGNVQYWFKNGQRQYVGAFDKSSRKSGSWVRWTQGGDKASEGNFVAGKKDGPWKIWGKDGSLIEEAVFKNGKPIKRNRVGKKKGAAAAAEVKSRDDDRSPSLKDDDKRLDPEDADERPAKKGEERDTQKTEASAPKERKTYMEALAEWKKERGEGEQNEVEGKYSSEGDSSKK